MKKKMALAFCCFLLAAWAAYADTGVVVHPNGSEVISSCFEEIHVWDVDSGNKIKTFGTDYEIPGYKIMAMAISSNGKRLVARYNSGIVMWDMERFTALWSIMDGYARHGVFSFSPDSTKIAYYSITDSADDIKGNVVIVDVETGNEITSIAKDLSVIYSLAYSPDGETLIGALNNTIIVWDAKSGKETGALTGHRDSVNDVAYSPDGNIILSASSDMTIKIWDAKALQETRTLSGHTNGVNTVSFSSNGLAAVSTGRYGEPINLWNTGTGDKVLSLPEGWYANAFFIRDNTQIISHRRGAWTTETITVWDANTGGKIKDISIPGDNES
jgi:WD40 repeat protein